MWTFVRQANGSSTPSRLPFRWPDLRQLSLLVHQAVRRALPRTYAVEHLLVAVAAVALSWYGFVSMSAAHEQAALINELQQLRIPGTSPSPAEPAVRALTARLSPRSVIGRIDLPRLKLSALAREGVDVGTLTSAIGHVPETALPGDFGNATFAGDRATLFRNLEGVRTGDEIVVSTAAGIYQYIVTATRVVARTETSLVGPTNGYTLTLITGYPFDYIGAAPERFIVRAERVAPTRPE